MFGLPPLVDPALYAWFPVTLFLFWKLPPHRALILAVMLGQMFLPEIQMAKVSDQAPEPKVFLILKMTKPNVICFTALLGAMIFDLPRLLTFRPRWFDLPVVVWCLMPFVSDLGVGVGTYESFAAMRDQTLTWGVPYFLGRVYFNNLENFRDLGVAMVLGGLIYVPLCLYEAKLFPRLHLNLYGFFPGDPNESIRMGGYRPVVFMTHGLATMLWMVAVTLMASWLWWTGAVSRCPWWLPGRRPPRMVAVVVLLLVTTVLGRSTGALAVGLVGLLGLLQLRWLRWPVLLAALFVASPLYMVGRISGEFTGREITGLVKSNVDEGRAGSFEFRLINEDKLIPRAQQRIWIGWGDTGLSNKIERRKKTDDDKAVTDGKWIIAFGCFGLVGLTALWTAMLLPAARFLLSFPTRWWSHPALAAPVAAAVILIIYMVDSISNAMDNAVFLLLAGGLAGLAGVRLTLPSPAAAEPARLPAELPRATVLPRRVARRPGVLSRPRP
jgi:hypothetical protein